MRKRFILSIDGGGLRGIIPSVVLSVIKSELEKKGLKKSFHEIFDLMAGTSTGGLIAMALSVPLYPSQGGSYDSKGGVSVHYLPKLYETLGGKVFPGSHKQIRKVFRQLFTSKYSSLPLQQVLRDLFKECTVKQALTNLLITSFDMKTMHPLFIKKRPSFAGGDEDPDFFMVDAALSTASVPTYFPPAYVGSINAANQTFCLVDGGIFCINPALSALIETRKIFPNAEYVILSLGTGIQIEEYEIDSIKKWGFFNWIAPWLGVPLISAVGDGQRISTNHMLLKLPQVTLYRLDINLDKGKGAMDDGRKENLLYLRHKADEMVSNHRDTLNQFINELIQQN